LAPKFFEKPAEFRKWLEKNHQKEKELLVGYYKKGCGKPSMTWPESVDEALCFGWIDGVRRSIDHELIRFGSLRASQQASGAMSTLKKLRSFLKKD
jgi:uncharacterized protein YdeI (YjbR/CyaY-like superfamily)